MKLDIGSERQRNGAIWSAHGDYQHGIDLPLRPCPFCGSASVSVSNTHTPHYVAECDSCGAEGPVGRPKKWDGHRILSRTRCERLHREAFTDAIDLWNQRALRT